MFTSVICFFKSLGEKIKSYSFSTIAIAAIIAKTPPINLKSNLIHLICFSILNVHLEDKFLGEG